MKRREWWTDYASDRAVRLMHVRRDDVFFLTMRDNSFAAWWLTDGEVVHSVSSLRRPWSPCIRMRADR